MNGYRQLDSSAVVAAGGRADLMAARCSACGRLTFPALACCPGCGGSRFTAAKLPRRGTLYSHTTVHIGPAGVDVPYRVGYVDLDGDVRVFGRLEIDAAAIEIGMPVTLDVRAGAAGRFEYAFTAPGVATARGTDA